MIYTRYLVSQIHKGALLVLMILVFLSLFFTMIQQLDDIGKGNFGALEFIQYLLMRMPSLVVDFMPLAALLGSILSLGNLASNSELIAFQSSGLSMKKFILVVLEAGFVLALLSFLTAEYIVPYSETQAKELKSSSMAARISMQSKRGVWIKDANNILFVEQLFPNGNARNVEIYQLDEKGRLELSMSAERAIADRKGWRLQKVRQTYFIEGRVEVVNQDQFFYRGSLSDQLLESLVVDPRLMSIASLRNYVNFLDDNKLNNDAESLALWRKIYAPVSILVMTLLAIPFVLGSQRQSNTGQRLVTGILLGLGFVVLNRVLIQLGEQLKLMAPINAFLPTLIFLFITVWLIRDKLVNR